MDSTGLYFSQNCFLLKLMPGNHSCTFAGIHSRMKLVKSLVLSAKIHRVTPGKGVITIKRGARWRLSMLLLETSFCCLCQPELHCCIEPTTENYWLFSKQVRNPNYLFIQQMFLLIYMC